MPSLRSRLKVSWSAGSHGFGRLGVDGISDHVWAPRTVATPPTATWETVSAGYAHSCGITRPGQLYCWGEMVARAWHPLLVDGL